LQEIRILLAAASPLYSRSLARMIGQGNGEAVYANSRADIDAQLKSTGVDLCFIQDEFAAGTGIELCEEYARTDDNTIPIIVFSRRADLEDEALEMGASGFLHVPCRAEDVLDLIERWAAMAQQSAAPVEDVQSVDKDGPLVLLVDDSNLIHVFVRETLKDSRYRLANARDGQEGYDTAIACEPDLIISDIDMPRLNGYEMCRKLKEDERLNHIPILMLSARGSGVDIDKGFDVGANDFLTKPVVGHELLSRIDLILGGSDYEEKRETILVVEDSAMQRSVIVQGLSQQGFHVIAAENGRIGLDMAIEHAPELVVTDSEMPIMNGRDLTRELKKRDDLKDVPVLMLSAADSPLNRAKGHHAGVAAFLTKPFTPDKVVVIAEKLIGERRLLRERRAMQHYLSSSAAEAASLAAEQRGNVANIMRAEEKFTTMLFSDIVGFTPLTERMEATALVSLLNEYFDTMAPLFKENGGSIDKFIGDAIMAIFVESPERPVTECAYNAVCTGLAMLESLAIFNEQRSEQIDIRIGINSGPVIMGDIGSRLYRRDYTVIGDNVNIGARLESAATPGTVLVSEDTFKLVEGRFEAEILGPISVKGKSEPISVYRIDAIATAETTS